MRRRPLLLLLVIAAASVAHAQSERILGKDNIAFARELYRRGLTDLATGLCEAVEKSGKADPAEKTAVSALKLDLGLDLARDEVDLAKRKELIASILKSKEEFIQANGQTKEAEEARNNLPDVYRLLGETLTALLQKEKDPPAISKLRSEGGSLFARAEEALEARRQALKSQREDAEKDLQYMALSYNLPRTYYFHSVLYPPESFEKEKFLAKAIEAFQDFGLDYSDQLLNFEGFIYQGLCHKDLKQPDKALLDFDDAIKLRETYDQDDKGRYLTTPEAADIVSAAVLQKVLLLTEQKKYSEAIAAAKDYRETTPDALKAAQGLAVLAAQADAESASGDADGVGKTAQLLVEADPQGPWGARGRELQGKVITGSSGGKGLGSAQLMRIAESLAIKGDYERAVTVARQALDSAQGTDQVADASAEALLLIGAVYGTRGWFHEASAAYDAAAESYPGAEKAGDALWRAVNCYLELSSQEKRSFYARRVDERMKLLSTKYPNHPGATHAQLVEGKKLEQEQHWLQAAEVYQRLQPGSPAYDEGQSLAGKCFLQHARKLIQEGKMIEAKTFLATAEGLLKKAYTALEERAGQTLDREVLSQLDKQAFGARSTLASLYLLAGLNREAEVFPLFEGVEDRYANDPDKIASIWGYRIQALRAQGKLDEAVDLLESLIQKNPNARNVTVAAGVLARALDQRAIETRQKDPKSKEADDLWRRAARYYLLSVKPQASGDVAFTGKTSDLEDIANRLYVLGLHFNEIPEDQDSFVGWDISKTKSKDLWEQSAKLYEAVQESSPSYRTMISLARTDGFLGRWKESAAIYGRLFDQEKLIDPATKKFNRATLSAKPQLLYAYIEWGIAEYQTAVQEKDPDRFNRAFGIFQTICSNSEKESRLWWQAKYYWIRSLVDRGDYENAKISLRDVERNSQDFDQGRFGFKSLFLELKAELAKK